MKTAVLGANPAWQKTLVFNDFSCNKVNRAITADEFASGKGVNFCRACIIHGASAPLLLQFAGGDNGRKLVSMLDALDISHYTSITQKPTRCCITILNKQDNSTTECIEPSFAATDEEIEKLLEMAENIMPECSVSAICGTLPGDTDNSVYSRFAAIAAKHDVPLLLDACKGIDGIFETNCVVDLKVNKEELFKISSEKSITSAVKQLFSRYAKLRTVAVTDGADTAFASDGKKIIYYHIPEIKNIVSTLGCGDTASAVYSSCLGENMPFELAFKKALAAASANCLSEMCGQFNTNDAAEIEKLITIIEGVL